MGTKGIDQRPYDREKFNDNFDAIFGKKEKKKEEVKDAKPNRDESHKDRG